MTKMKNPQKLGTLINATSSGSVSPKAYQINRGGKAAAIGPIYEGFKQIGRAYGFYQDIEPYLPETIVEKYKYQPHKRVAGYLGQAFHAKKKFKSSSHKFNQEFCDVFGKYGYNHCKSNNSHSGF